MGVAGTLTFTEMVQVLSAWTPPLKERVDEPETAVKVVPLRQPLEYEIELGEATVICEPLTDGKGSMKVIPEMSVELLLAKEICSGVELPAGTDFSGKAFEIEKGEVIET